MEFLTKGKQSLQDFLRIVVLLLVFAGMPAAAPTAPDSGVTVTDLRCEYLTNPLGIDTAHPQFTWNLFGDRRDIRQEAYQILVASARERLTEQAADLWDSKRVESDRSVYVPYYGKPLQSNTTYFWKARAWDSQQGVSDWSEAASFHTGLLRQSDWSARWITPHDPGISSPILHKEFTLQKPVKRAYAFVSGLGYYELYLNGKKVGNHVLDPGWTDYGKRVLYATYEVGEQLREGANAAGIMLGNAYYTLSKSDTAGNRYMAALRNPGPPKKAILQLLVEYADGSTQQIITDGSWKSHTGPITYNHFYGGEEYDARLEQAGWSEPGFDDSSWGSVNVAKNSATMDAQLLSAIQVVDTVEPVTRTHPAPGVYLYDLGQNLPGWARIRVRGTRGTVVTIRSAETLNGQRFPKPLEPGDTLSTKHSYHANVYARYTLRGGGEEIYAPRFFYKGFRYVEVTIDRPGGIDSLQVTGQVVHSGLRRNGTFASSDDLLNQIHELSRWAVTANTHSVPTDCPQREKLGYTGDGQVIAEASIHLFDMTQFYEKWLNDIGDAQHEDGYVPRTAPEVRAGGGPGWGSACIFVPWDFYTYYGNPRILTDHYKVMKQWAGFLESKARDGILHPYPINDNRYDFLGDWVPPGRGIGQTDRWTGPEMRMLTNTFVYHRNIQLLAQIAGVLGHETDADRYTRLAEDIETAFNQRFLHPGTNQYGNGRQPFNAFALADDLVPEARQPAVAGQIAKDIRDRNGHLDTGISGTKFLFDVLTENGYVDLAYAVATQTTYPSYGYWIKNGATTLWEQWNGEYSHNHQMFGSVVAWFYKYLAGIRPLEPGYKRIAIKPYPPRELKQVSATLETVHGEVSSAWTQQPAGLRMWISLPANTGGVVAIPVEDGTRLTVTEGGRVIWSSAGFVPGTPGIQDARMAGKYLEVTVGSGTYSFEAVQLKSEEQDQPAK